MMKAEIEIFLERFPKNATSRADATDEIRDLSRTLREFLEEYDGVTVEPVDFKACKTPAEWNTKGRDSILDNFEMMSPSTQQAFYTRFREWFEQPEPKSQSEAKREELIGRIYDLHAQVKKTEFSDLIVDSARLEKHLAAQSNSTLSAMKRFYEGLLEN